MLTSKMSVILSAKATTNGSTFSFPYAPSINKKGEMVYLDASFKLAFSTMGDTADERWESLLSYLRGLPSDKSGIAVNYPKLPFGTKCFPIWEKKRSAFSGPQLADALINLAEAFAAEEKERNAKTEELNANPPAGSDATVTVPNGEPSEKWSKAQLVSYAQSKGIDVSGSKADILARLAPASEPTIS